MEDVSRDVNPRMLLFISDQNRIRGPNQVFEYSRRYSTFLGLTIRRADQTLWFLVITTGNRLWRKEGLDMPATILELHWNTSHFLGAFLIFPLGHISCSILGQWPSPSRSMSFLIRIGSGRSKLKSREGSIRGLTKFMICFSNSCQQSLSRER